MILKTEISVLDCPLHEDEYSIDFDDNCLNCDCCGGLTEDGEVVCNYKAGDTNA